MFETDAILRDGFQLRQRSYSPPQDLSHFDPASKKEITVCNLFMNERLGIQEIVRRLGESYGNVVHILISQGVVYERRKSRQTRAATADPLQSFFKSLH